MTTATEQSNTLPTPYYQSEGMTLYHGDVLEVLREIPDQSIQCVVTSPPYWSLRDYGADGQIGMEPTLGEYIAGMVDVFAEVRRVLAVDGTCWLNLGDTYAGGGRGGNPDESVHKKQSSNAGTLYSPFAVPDGLKRKDLIGVPWRVAFALQEDGWWLRSDIIWSKPNPMPESVTDRPTKAHEYIFLLTKSERYFYDAAAIREPAKDDGRGPGLQSPYAPPVLAAHRGARHDYNGKHKTDKQRGHSRRHAGFNDRWNAMTREEQQALGANKRSVWTVATKPYTGAHFATFPPKLIEPCILAGSRAGDVVLDPFMGSGTTAFVAQKHGRRSMGIDINAEYLDLAIERNAQKTLWFGGVA